MNLAGSIRVTKCGVLIICFILVVTIYYVSVSEKKISNYLFMRHSKEINLRKLLIGSIQAAEKGGKEVLHISENSNYLIKQKGLTKEGVIDPVTIADFNSHCVMQRGLQRIFPKLKIISEEDNSKVDCPEIKLFDLDPTVVSHEMTSVFDENVNIDDITVWIDPLDATKEFTEKLYKYVTTMVCVAYKGKPIIGVIHNPFTKVTVWAWIHKSKSANLNDIKPNNELLDKTIVTVSRSHVGDGNIKSKQLFGDNAKIISAAGSGYKTLQVIYNNATAYFHSTAIKKWDICAGNAIINSVGGKMTNLQGEEIDYTYNKMVLNDKGLLATMKNHDIFIKKYREMNG